MKIIKENIYTINNYQQTQRKIEFQTNPVFKVNILSNFDNTYQEKTKTLNTENIEFKIGDEIIGIDIETGKKIHGTIVSINKDFIEILTKKNKKIKIYNNKEVEIKKSNKVNGTYITINPPITFENFKEFLIYKKIL